MRRQDNTVARAGWLAALALAAVALSGGDAAAQPASDYVCQKRLAEEISQQGGGTLLLSLMTDDTQADCRAAVSAFRAASPVVVGDPGDARLHVWIAAVMMDPQWLPKFREGLRFSDAVTWLKQRLAKDAAALDRAKAIDNAYAEVYGGESKPEEQAVWDTQVRAQKAWYATIVGELVKELQANPLKKQRAIIRAYKAAMGREPTVGDGQYWQARPDHYRQIREAIRAWLYTPQGAKDLVETTTRALRDDMGMEPSEAQVKIALARYTEKRLIYEEMLKQ